MLSLALSVALGLHPLTPATPAQILAQVRGQTPRLEGGALEAAVEELARIVDTRYVFADDGHAMAERLRARLWEGAYEGRDLDGLAAALTTDLRTVRDDRHLHVYRDDAPRGAEPDPEAARARRAEAARRDNHGFRKLEILDGNVGYLELRGFASAAAARETAVGAMAFFANVDALIIDLRENGGGEPSMIQLLASYFFAEPTLLNRFEWRGQSELEENWTLATVPGKRLVDVPLFVLTSQGTFSAAEEFSYDMKCLRRGTLVGERTGGGAHPGDTHDFAPGLRAFVPNGRAINPITGTNWEGTGVEPDVAVPAGEALARALSEARAAIARRAGAPR